MFKALRGLLAASLLMGSLAAISTVEAAPEKQVIDVAHSTLNFTAVSFLLDTEGTFKKWEGELMLDRADITKSSVNVSIDVSSIDTRIEKRDEHLKGSDFFDVAKFPKITFKSTKVEKSGDKGFNLVGELTMHGVTKTVTLPVTIDRLQDNYSRFRASGNLSRKDFGITFDSKLNPIEDNVKFELVINIKKP
ncbi:MAG: YceI family protein [Myxococcota bacterium]